MVVSNVGRSGQYIGHFIGLAIYPLIASVL